ncbi:hypothetical protein SAMN05421676_102367 [Salinibacillus kushneri]|uniref:C1q domain-containing protein n=1 Tax=Salinibacillus kushneri TaxID=237682 RepID=A0A1I0B798_9BACI|nr:hypothetical protein [Salinibacillus kushneri]SET02583.1 hypothetical protein SAMN05421676_102367 [Salinibacillus kushneri]
MERSYFFDSTDQDQRIYQAADFARFHAQIIGNGVSNTADLPDLTVTEKQNMTVSLGAGYAFANGYMYENTSAMDLTHDTAEPTEDRIDRVVIAFDNDPDERRVYAYIKKGTPSTDPVPPALTRNDYVHELSVAQVRIIAGKSFVEQSQITDERTNRNVCGYIPLHNIYRGIDVDENGIFSVINSPYLDTANNQSWSGNNDVHTKIPFGAARKNINTNYDAEKSEITIQKSGVYMFRIYVSTEPSLEPGSEIQFRTYVNGENSRLLFSFVVSHNNDNIFVNHGFQYFEAGDRVTFYLHPFSTGLSTINFNDAFLTWAKIQ